MNTRLINLIQDAPRPRIVVVGDIILDTYIQGDAGRISPEAPIQVLDVLDERSALGGAANVAANLSSLGAEVALGGVVGDDVHALAVRTLLEDQGIDTAALITDPSRPTINKTRVIARNQQLLRIDREVRSRLAEEAEARLLSKLGPLLAGTPVVVLSDYAKGVLSDPVIRFVVKQAGSDVLVDPKGRDYSRYKGCRLITPNRKEAEEATGLALKSREDLRAGAKRLFDAVGVREVVITLGGDGIFYADQRNGDRLVPAQSRSVYDVTGAGDTVISMLAFCLATGMSLDDAVRIANAAAGIVVGKLGVAAPTRQELIELFSSGSTRFIDKIVDREEAARVSRQLRAKGEKLVFTNGCFDLIHGGHVQYLRAAKGLGDRLMVGVNDDDSVRRLKGPRRPVLSLAERMEVMASLQMVDYVVPFGEDTPLELIRAVTPRVLVKGEDWREKGVVGQEWVESQGGEVMLIPLREGYSTTGVIERVLHRYKGEDG